MRTSFSDRKPVSKSDVSEGIKSGRGALQSNFFRTFCFYGSQTVIKGNSPGLLRDCQKVVLNLTKKEQGSSGGTNFNSFSKDAWIKGGSGFCLP